MTGKEAKPATGVDKINDFEERADIGAASTSPLRNALEISIDLIDLQVLDRGDAEKRMKRRSAGNWGKGVEVGRWENPFATDRALYLSMSPFVSCLIRNTQRVPIALRPFGSFASSQVPLRSSASISVTAAL